MVRLALDTSISASSTAVFTLPTSTAEAVMSAGVASRCVSIGIASRHFLWELVRDGYEDFGVLLALSLSVCRIDASADDMFFDNSGRVRCRSDKVD